MEEPYLNDRARYVPKTSKGRLLEDYEVEDLENVALLLEVVDATISRIEPYSIADQDLDAPLQGASFSVGIAKIQVGRVLTGEGDIEKIMDKLHAYLAGMMEGMIDEQNAGRRSIRKEA